MEDNGIKDLRDRIETLTSVMKCGTYQNRGLKQNQPQNPTMPNKLQKKLRDNGQGSPKKSNRLVTSALGPFKPGQKPYQCYKCGGWGNSFRNCPILGNIDWRSLSRAKIPPKVGTPDPDNKAPDQQ